MTEIFEFLWKQSHAVSLHKKANWMEFECWFLRIGLKIWWKSHSESQEMARVHPGAKSWLISFLSVTFPLSCRLLQFCTERELVSLRWHKAWSIHGNFWISSNISLNLMRFFSRARQSVVDRVLAFLFSS